MPAAIRPTAESIPPETSARKGCNRLLTPSICACPGEHAHPEDKAICKRVLGYHRIRQPFFHEVPVGRAKPAGRLVFPMSAEPKWSH